MQRGFWNLECTLQGKPREAALSGEQLAGGDGDPWRMACFLWAAISSSSLIRTLNLSMIEPFEDATYAPQIFDLELIYCWRALKRAGSRK